MDEQNLEARIAALEARLDDFDKKYAEAEDSYEANQWESKYGDKLHAFDNKMHALNGDDFNLVEESRQEYKNYPDTDPDEFVDALVDTITEELAKVKEALADGDVAEAAHIAEEAEEKAEEVADKIDESAHDEVKADDTPAEESKPEPEAEDVPAEEPKVEGEVVEEAAVSDEDGKDPAEDEDNDEEYQKFIEELKKSSEYKHEHKDEEDKE